MPARQANRQAIQGNRETYDEIGRSTLCFHTQIKLSLQSLRGDQGACDPLLAQVTLTTGVTVFRTRIKPHFEDQTNFPSDDREKFNVFIDAIDKKMEQIVPSVLYPQGPDTDFSSAAQGLLEVLRSAEGITDVVNSALTHMGYPIPLPGP